MNKIRIVDLAGEEAAELIPEVIEIQRRVWLSTYPDKELGITEEAIRAKYKNIDEKIKKYRKYYFEDKDRKQWYAFDGNNLIGYCFVEKKTDMAKLSSIYILQKYQGQGVGSRLIEKALEYLQDVDIELKCAKHNQKAISFYKKHGFEIVDKNPKPFELPNNVKMPLVKMRRDK